MPRWLLEEHLLVLAGRLESCVPARSSRYAPLRRAAHTIRSERLGILEEQQVRALEAFFEEHAREPSRTSLRAGALLAAAVADEGAGIERAVPSLQAWLGDPQQFSVRWIEAVERTLMEARQQTSVARGVTT
jgi:hypothetical protein